MRPRLCALLLSPRLLTGYGVIPDVFHTTAAPLISSYQEALHHDPLQTQVLIGVVLAIAGDAIAQQQHHNEHPEEDPNSYDVKRAVSFAAFDGTYRAVQHFIYPPMIAVCQGNLLSSLTGDVKLASSIEQALASQLLIIPVVYYPVFFAVTGLVQGLSARQTFERASSSFWPLMKRNWLFWIPVQFGVFNYVHDESLQISLLIACGLLWTVILSVLAGQAASEKQPPVVLQELLEELPELEMERVVLAQPSNNTAVLFQAPSDVEMDMEMEFRA